MFRRSFIFAWVAALMTVALWPVSGCLEPGERVAPVHTDNCTTCHGSPTRPGSDLLRSAPPFNVAASTDPRAPGNGAHTIHLSPNDLHDGIACEECHVVPEETASPGHIDSALPAELTFGGRATLNERAPSYDVAAHRCADTYCHLDATPSWIPEGVPRARCSACHGSPPPAPHPASDACHLCHGDVVDAAGTIMAKSRHIDGFVDVDDRCDTCHGTGDLGAPPPDLRGEESPTARGVGAHVAHLAGGDFSAPVACEGCHIVPANTGDEGHLGDDDRAELTFTGVALTEGRAPIYDGITTTCANTWCHGSSEPAWTDIATLSCDSCHGFPPAAPHPQMLACERCHAPVVDALGVLTPERHIDGIVDVELPPACNSCHGDATSAAPPVDLAGNTLTSARGVGAHRIHVEGTSTSRAVPCNECHRVPGELLDTGHVDTLGPAELRFSGVARAFGASPSFDGNTCADSYCHGDRFVLGHESGGLVTEPIWTLTDGSQSLCTSCHGLPPPPPHPAGPSFCSDCHPNIGFPLTILDPSQHVDGKVDL